MTAADPAAREVRSQRPLGDDRVQAVMGVLGAYDLAEEIAPASHRPKRLPTDANAGYFYANRVLDALHAAGFAVVADPDGLVGDGPPPVLAVVPGLSATSDGLRGMGPKDRSVPQRDRVYRLDRPPASAQPHTEEEP